MIEEVDPVMACHTMAACHIAAVPHSLVDCWPVDKLAECFPAHKHTSVHHIHTHSSGEKELPGNRELDAHNLDHWTVHNCNSPGMEDRP